MTNDFPPFVSFLQRLEESRTDFYLRLLFIILEKSGGGGGPKKSNAYNRFMKSELKKLKEEFPDLDHVERSVRRLTLIILTDSC